MESEAKTLERYRTELQLKYKCSLPDASNANDKNAYHSLEETLIPRSPKIQSRPKGNVARRSIDGPKSMLNKPEIKPFDPRHDLRAPLDLQARAEKVIDEINHVEKITSDDLIKVHRGQPKYHCGTSSSICGTMSPCKWKNYNAGMQNHPTNAQNCPVVHGRTPFVSHAKMEMKQLVLMISLPTCHTCRVKWFHGR